MPRWCPVCQQASIVGHGRRRKQAHDGQHDWIGVRRGRCPLCKKTFTILPMWSPPHGHYSYCCRQAASESGSESGGWEQSAPHCKDPCRLPDPATLRRWACRKLISLWFWVKTGLGALYHGVPFSEAIALLRRWYGVGSLLSDMVKFYQVQLHRHPEAVAYLDQRGLHRPELIEELRIGYAPGRCLRAWLMSLGYPLRYLQQAGVVTPEGFDTFTHRIVFPLDGNLYGRSIGKAAPHQFLPGGKGGLYGWEKVRACPEIILVEGLFDLAVLWQAGFPNVTCAMGIYLNATQIQQLCDGAARVVYLAFDSDSNGSGQHAARQIAQRLWAQGAKAFPVELPDGHDPNSFFVSGGGDAQQFRLLLQRAHA